jgi:hypothetical protein
MSIYGWIYLIQQGYHRKHHEHIYKIDCTIDFNRRINEYPAYSQILSVCPVDNDKKCERELIKEFKSEFEFRNDIGYEYFEGDERDMKSVFKTMSQNIYLTEKKRLLMILIEKSKIKG